MGRVRAVAGIRTVSRAGGEAREGERYRQGEKRIWREPEGLARPGADDFGSGAK